MRGSFLEIAGLIIMTIGVTLFVLFATRHKEPDQASPPIVDQIPQLNQ